MPLPRPLTAADVATSDRPALPSPWPPRLVGLAVWSVFFLGLAILAACVALLLRAGT